MLNFRPPVRAGVLVAVVALASAAPCSAGVIVSPPGPNVAGNGMGVAPFTNPGDTNGNRYQQVYSSAFFAGGGPVQLITDVGFRPKQGAFLNLIGNTLNISNVTVRLSTTPRAADTNFPNGLNADLATNVGADAMTVYQGALTLTTDRLFGDTDVEDFDFLIQFQNPFLYQPGRGNLLLELIIPPTATVTSNGTIGFTQLDSFTDGFPSTDGTASAFDANLLDGLTIGSNSTTGAVTRFSTTPVATPEPTTLALFGGLALGLLGVRRRVKR